MEMVTEMIFAGLQIIQNISSVLIISFVYTSCMHTPQFWIPVESMNLKTKIRRRLFLSFFPVPRYSTELGVLRPKKKREKTNKQGEQTRP